MTIAPLRRTARALACITLVATLALPAAARAADAADIGQVKVVRGQVTIERGDQTLAAAVGLRVRTADRIRTGADGAVGITMNDDALLSAGPNSLLSLDRYAFDATSGKGRFESGLSRGTLAVISGRIAKDAPDAMTVRTPSAILGVRGTEFAVAVDE